MTTPIRPSAKVNSPAGKANCDASNWTLAAEQTLSTVKVPTLPVSCLLVSIALKQSQLRSYVVRSSIKAWA